MSPELKISIGQYSSKGRKEINQDFHGALIPQQPALSLKGIAIAVADGIGSSNVSQIASESAVKGFLMDYYCTSDSWSVKTSAQRVIAATNSWLHSQTRRSQNPHEKDKGYVCTLSVMIVKSTTAHIFHAGDSRIYRVAGNSLEQLTNDHRIAVSSEQVYLSRALGMDTRIELDYRTLQLSEGDIFVLTTDGVHEHVSARYMRNVVDGSVGDLDAAARTIAEEAYNLGSPDNLTVQIARVDGLPSGDASEVIEQAAELPLPPLLEPRTEFDGYRIVRQIHGSSRSHIYLATDQETGDLVTVKIPSIDLRGDAAYLRRFMMEEWVARRIDSAYVLKPRIPSRRRSYLYVVTEFVDGQTLTQWMIDNPSPDLETVRKLVEQIARGLQAFHRMEMLHQDLRPDNIMIDKTGTVKIIDFGSVNVAGVAETAHDAGQGTILGTAQYTAPEYFLGRNGTSRSDIFSLGVITYQILTGRLPYGAEVARARTKSRQGKLRYTSAIDASRDIPAWIDGVLRKAVHADPYKRYDELSEFIYDLRHPNQTLAGAVHVPWIERNPLLFWKAVSFLLACAVVLLVTALAR